MQRQVAHTVLEKSSFIKFGYLKNSIAAQDIAICKLDSIVNAKPSGRASLQDLKPIL